MVSIHNPNEGIGLIRTGFELTALADDGSIIDVYGTEGLPGALCCTIYQLPPGGDIGLAINMDQAAADPVSLELAITGRWVEWSTVEVPTPELSEVTVNPSEFGGPQVVGRVTTPSAPEDGPFNVNVIAIVDSPIGMLVLSGFVECVATADARAFSIDSSISPVSEPFTIRDSFAYTSTVPGVTQNASNC